MTNERTLVIGDIHGGFRALEQLMSLPNISHKDTLIFLGDYVDGWSQSPKVIDYLIDLSTRYRCIFIRGNHDELCRKWLEEGVDNKLWEQHGGKSTKEAYRYISLSDKQRHITFLKNLKNYYIDKKNRLYVHAGYTNLRGVANEYFPEMCYWDRTLWEMVLCLDASIDQNHPYYPKRLKHYKEIFIGHTPTLRYDEYVPMYRHSVWNIDTGAAYFGALTMIDADKKTYWQTQTVDSLYPDEHPRKF